MRHARSAEFMGQPIIHLPVWMRAPGDTVFSVGALLIAWFVCRLRVAPRQKLMVMAPTAPATR